MVDSQDRHRSIGIFADQDVGLAAVQHVLTTAHDDLAYVVTTGTNEISEYCQRQNCKVIFANEISFETAHELLGDVQLFILAWWPQVLPKYLIEIPKKGTVNFHPSWLPYNRGKHYNFWTLVEDTPYGVTIHMVDEKIDQGSILFQAPIHKTWEDNGGTLYESAKSEMIKLFRKHYEDLALGNYTPFTQDLKTGSFHLAKELEPASEILLDKNYTGRELLNLLRARTFPGKPSCYFNDKGRKYEVRISINEVKDECK